MLSGFGSSLSIKETTSDNEDEGGETGAVIWDTAGSRGSVLRLALKGFKRDRGILAANFAQPYALNDENEPAVDQEIISVGDKWSIRMGVGAADRFLIRGFSLYGDDTTPDRGGFTNPFDLRSGWTLDSSYQVTSEGTKLFSLHNTRNVAGMGVWTAPQGATVAGSATYDFVQNLNVPGREERWNAVLTRAFGPANAGQDSPTAPGVTLDMTADAALPAAPYMAVLGEPLDAMVSNFGQTDNGYHSLGSASTKVASQGFTTGSDQFGYRLQGIGVNIEGSDSSFPDGPTSVSVAVHADSNGKPGEKLFDLVSPTEYGEGHSFFEAPPGTNLEADTAYVLVWRHLGGTWHRLRRTGSDGEDSGALEGSSIANALYVGADLSSLSADSGGRSLEIRVYSEALKKAPFLPGGIPVTKSWLHIPEDAEVGDQFRVLFVTHHGTEATSGEIEDYNDLVQFEASGRTRRYEEVEDLTDPVIRKVAPHFKAVVCTADDDARTNTGMTDAIGVPIHWLDGGWDDRPTLIADAYDQFYGGDWMNHDWGAYVSGNSMYFHDNEAIWTGCLSTGVAHPQYPMGNADMVVVGTPRDGNYHPLGAVDVGSGYLALEHLVEIKGVEPGPVYRPVYRHVYAISPVFTVVDSPEVDEE